MKSVAIADPKLARQTAALPWFIDGATDNEGSGISALGSIAVKDIELARQTAALPWFIDGVTGHEWRGISALSDIAAKDLELARQTASLPWFIDGVIDHEWRGISALSDIAAKDLELARQTASLPWFADDLIDYEESGISALSDIAAKDLELARQTASLPWFIDGVIGHGWRGISVLSDIAAKDLELAKQAASLPWFMDGVTDNEWSSIAALSSIAAKDPELARQAASLSWFMDGVTDNESLGLSGLEDIARSDVELARQVANVHWFIDGVRARLSGLGKITANDIQLARQVAVVLPWSDIWRDLYQYALRSLGSIANRPDDLDHLTAMSWFADGLSDEEAVLVAVLGAGALRGTKLYRDLLQVRHIQTKTVSLPLAGDVNIWVIQKTPFPLGEDLITIIEDTIRISEGLLGAFPTTDVILLVLDEEERLNGWYAGTHMALTRYSSHVPSVRHETAHYYFHAGPVWFFEGAAQFVQAYVKDRTNVQSIRERRFAVSREAEGCLVPNQRENIYDFEYAWSQGAFISCIYVLGENFLLRTFATIGEEAMAAALRDILEGGGITEEKIYEAFARHAPPDKLENFLNLYRTLHGGPYGDDSG